MFLHIVIGDQVFQQSFEIPMGVNCAPLFANPFFNSWGRIYLKPLYMRRKKISQLLSS
jgi:hypothetical protein